MLIRIVVGSFLLTLLTFLSACSGGRLTMQSEAMAPTVPRGSTFQIDRDAYTRRGPERFDIIVFEYQPVVEGNIQEPARGEEISYRVIGLPGETVEVTEAGVSINGSLLQLPPQLQYRPAPPSGDYRRFNRVTLPGNAYFLLGDNTQRALDGRYWGWVTRERIRGRVILE